MLPDSRSRKRLFLGLACTVLVGGGLVEVPALAGPPTDSFDTAATLAAGPSQDPEPLTDLWTATSRTYLEPDGSYQTQVAPDPINYQDAGGDYVPIVDKLVPSDDPSYDVENKAGPYSVLLPADLSDAPVEFQANGSAINLTLVGADGGGDVTGRTDSYDNVLPGVDISYTALNTGIEETTTLADASAPSSFKYAVDTSSSLIPTLSASGGLDFVDPLGQSQLSVPPPAVQDASGAAGPASLKLSTAGDILTVSVNRVWLTSPDRVFPVTVDPSITITGAITNCYIAGGGSQNGNFCVSTSTNKLLKVGYASTGTTPYRSLLKFDLSAIPATSNVVSAQLGLHLSASTTSTSTSVELDQVASPVAQWTTAVTWKSPIGSPSGTWFWSTPGGDYAAPPNWTTQSVGPTAGWYYWYPTTLVDGWVHGTIPNQGMLLKEPTENVNQVLSFDSTQATSSTVRPVLTVVYHSWQGEEPFAPSVRFPLTDRMGLVVDLANGNLELHANDVNIAGTGLSLRIDRFYNSKLGGAGDLGTSWFLAVATGIKLTTYGGSVDYRGPSGDHLAFILKPDGTYVSPAGVDATLVKNGDGTFDLTFHANGERYHFGANGRFLSDTDRNGNHINFGFSGSQLSTITDTQGRVTTVTYNAAGFISQLADVSGRTWQYTYDANNDLVSYRDPAGGVTTYVYNTSHNLTQITDPVCVKTNISYSGGAVASITRGVSDIKSGCGAANAATTTSFAYGSGSTQVTDSNNHTTTYYYDANGRGTQVVDPVSDSFQATWNTDNKLTSSTEPLGGSTQVTYDANNNPTRVTLPTGATTTLAYGTPPIPTTQRRRSTRKGTPRRTPMTRWGTSRRRSTR